jgi:tripartite-type tricarboxylate transporter receptor subunit TctC
VVENRAGAGGNIGVAAVARSLPDGYTIGVTTVTQLITNTYLYRNMTIEPMRELAMVSINWENQNVFVVPTRFVPATTLGEFIAWAKARPEGVSFCSSGVGFTSHLLPELFGLRTGIRVTHVPFRGAAEAATTMLRGEVQFAIDNLASWRGFIDRGDVRALAITDSRRSPLAPAIPTMAELNMPEFTSTIFAGFIAPAGTPDAIRESLARELGTISRRPEIIQRIGAAGATVTATTPEEMRLRAERERPYWAELVRISGARLD